MKTLLIATALFFSFQASAGASACAAAQRAEAKAEQREQRLADSEFGSPAHREAVGALSLARANRIIACEFAVIGEF